MNFGLESGSAQKALLSSHIPCHFSSSDLRNATLSFSPSSGGEAIAALQWEAI
jgi:hypothetical protein